PDANSEYYLYQILLGLWPSTNVTAEFSERVWICYHKSLREAGIFTSWKKPNEEYEMIAKEFLVSLLTPEKDNAFFHSIKVFVEEIARFGYWNSLSALILKMGAPGIVDLYQGEELWDFSLM